MADRSTDTLPQDLPRVDADVFDIPSAPHISDDSDELDIEDELDDGIGRRLTLRWALLLACVALVTASFVLGMHALADLAKRFDQLPVVKSASLLFSQTDYADSVDFSFEANNNIGGMVSVFKGDAIDRNATATVYESSASAVWEGPVAETAVVIDTSSLTRLDHLGVRYFITDGKKSLTNVSGLEGKTTFSALDYHDATVTISAHDGVLQEGAGVLAQQGIYFDLAQSEQNELSWFVAYPPEYFTQVQATLDECRETLSLWAEAVIACLALALGLFVTLIVLAGTKRADGSRRLWAWDHCPTEMQLILIIFCTTLGVVVCWLYTAALYDPWSAFWPGVSTDAAGVVTASPLAIFLIAALCAVLTFITLWCMLSIIRTFKAHIFTRCSLICRFLLFIWRGVKALASVLKSGFDGRNPLAKTVVLVILLWLTTCMAGLLFIASLHSGGDELLLSALLVTLPLAGALVLSVRWAQRYAQLRWGIEEVSAGKLGYRIDAPQESTAEFDVMARRINDISGTVERAVQNELKNQRLKTDLISNVSHDLKTPLTSIISYTDLLVKEGLDSPNAPDYLSVLVEKSERLRKLTDDLFEAAKASSGALPVRSERLDLRALVDQALAETAEGFAASQLEVIPSPGEETLLANADGTLLWRVLDNLLGNVRKYALPGSRVYVDMGSGADGLSQVSDFSQPGDDASSPVPYIQLEIKNISAQPLNIPADELMERFKRGDESRATEGSGLGLAISRDLAHLMGGHLDVVIDGDLFKVVLLLPCWRG